MLNKKFSLLVVLLAIFAFAGCSEDSNPLSPVSDSENKSNPDQTTIVDVALSVNADSGEFSTLIAALVSADLVDAMNSRGQFTVFAPTDAAFATLGLNAENIGDLDTAALSEILLYHVTKGRRVAEDVVASEQIRMLNGDFTRISLMDGMAFIDESTIVQTDVMADNGVIHIIDAVLLPEVDSEPENDFGDRITPEPTTIVDVALSVNADSGEFSTLIAALVSADLVDVMSSRGQFTVFAPTDAAFAALGLNAENIGDLDTAALTDILLYHVAKGRRLAADVVGSEQIRMLNGDFTRISLMDGTAFIDESTIVQTDVLADNGVIHIIDAVLLPAEDSNPWRNFAE